jgi:hypothetical protein
MVATGWVSARSRDKRRAFSRSSPSRVVSRRTPITERLPSTVLMRRRRRRPLR